MDFRAIIVPGSGDRSCQIAAKLQQLRQSQEFMVTRHGSTPGRGRPASLSRSVVISSTEPKAERIDLAASAARVISARRLAARQARVVEASTGGADPRAIDLLLLLQESVLVFDETHSMLEALAARESALDRGIRALQVRRDRRKAAWLRPLVLAAKVVALFIVSACILELIDPAPMDVLAFLKDRPASIHSVQP